MSLRENCNDLAVSEEGRTNNIHHSLSARNFYFHYNRDNILLEREKSAQNEYMTWPTINTTWENHITVTKINGKKKHGADSYSSSLFFYLILFNCFFWN